MLTLLIICFTVIFVVMIVSASAVQVTKIHRDAAEAILQDDDGTKAKKDDRARHVRTTERSR